MTTHCEYDILGRTSRIFSPEGMEVRYRYDCLDRPEQICYRNGIRTSYQYDADGNVSHLETRMGSDLLLSFRYQYDGNGNRLSKTGTQGPATDGSSALEITYQYDVRGQLLEENRKDAVFCYNYDAAGNRIQKEETGKIRRSGQSIPTMRRTSSSAQKRSGQTGAAVEIPLPTVNREVY